MVASLWCEEVSSQISIASANALLYKLLAGIDFTPAATLYLAAYLSDPTENDIGTEVAGGSYARQPIVFEAPAGPVTLIGSVVNSTANHGSASIVSPTPTPGKVYLLSVFTLDGAGAVPNVSSVAGLGLTWTNVFNITSTDTRHRLSLWWASGAAAASAVTVTYNAATADDSHLHLVECDRVNLSDPFSQIVTQIVDFTAATSVTITYPVTPSASETQYAIFGVGNNTVNIVPRTNWTERSETDAINDLETQALLPQQVGSPDAAASCTFQNTGSINVLMAALALRAKSTLAPRLVTNLGQLTYPIATGNWGRITHMAVRDAPSGGNLIAWGPLSGPLDVPSGTQLYFLAGTVKVRM